MWPTFYFKIKVLVKDKKNYIKNINKITYIMDDRHNNN